MEFNFKGEQIILRLSQDRDVPAIRKLVNDAYKELSDKGWNYTATYQDEDMTRERIAKGRAFVLECQSEIIATILFFEENHFTNRKTAYIGQFAVKPSLKKSGLGTWLMDYCENLAKSEGFEGLQLDTAKPAEHLVQWYLSRGFKIVGELRWDGKTYESFIFEKLF